MVPEAPINIYIRGNARSGSFFFAAWGCKPFIRFSSVLPCAHPSRPEPALASRTLMCGRTMSHNSFKANFFSGTCPLEDTNSRISSSPSMTRTPASTDTIPLDTSLYDLSSVSAFFSFVLVARSSSASLLSFSSLCIAKRAFCDSTPDFNFPHLSLSIDVSSGITSSRTAKDLTMPLARNSRSVCIFITPGPCSPSIIVRVPQQTSSSPSSGCGIIIGFTDTAFPYL
mmetsp:Transcript_23997/g.29031  ORF Transcript_23997/g.29031 Transcript_23997/m.29031 type:complete len:227 (-) Transcript_23997:3067-3747(-)